MREASPLILSALRRSTGSVRVSRVCIASLTLGLALFANSVSFAEGPAVKASNLRVIANYDYTHINSDEVFEFSPTRLVNVAEVDIDSGGFTGIYTFPFLEDESLGARLIGGANFSKVHADTFEETKRHGLDLGGEVFWRDPSVGEFGLGTFYEYADAVTGPTDRSEHTAGVTAFGQVFVNDFLGYGPVDLDISAAFSDSDIEDNGSESAERTYAGRWGATLYPSDTFSVRTGGVYSRTNLGTGTHVRVVGFEADARLLLPVEPLVTLGAGFEVGDYEVGANGVQNYGSMFFGIGFSVTISFADAQSLLELNRNFY